MISEEKTVQLLQETISFAYEQKERQEDLKTSVEGSIHPNSSAVFKLMEKEGAEGVLGPAGAPMRRGGTQHQTFNNTLIILNPKMEEKLLISARVCLQFKLLHKRLLLSLLCGKHFLLLV